MQGAMEMSAGIYRNGRVLEKAAADLRSLQERYRNVTVQDRSRTFNTELTSILELGCMLDVAESMIQAAGQRQESRGSHQRTDFPARNDVDFLKHSLAHQREDAPPGIEFSPVTITRWPPGERVYGR
jgi:fumarate reductase flavoprotein subunit